MSRRVHDRKQAYIKIPLLLSIPEATAGAFDDFATTVPLASGETESSTLPPIVAWDGPEVEIPPNEDAGS